MAGFSGRNFTISVDDGASGYDVIAGGRDLAVTLNEVAVDITSKDDSGVRQLLPGSIVKSVTASGTGVFRDDATIKDMSDALLSGTHSEYQIDTDSTNATTAGATYTGNFRVTRFEYAGSYDGEINYSFTLESDGTVAVE